MPCLNEKFTKIRGRGSKRSFLPRWEIEPRPRRWERRILTTRPPGMAKCTALYFRLHKAQKPLYNSNTSNFTNFLNSGAYCKKYFTCFGVTLMRICRRVLSFTLYSHPCLSTFHILLISGSKTDKMKILFFVKKDFLASAGNRTRATRVAGEYSTTEPPMLTIPL